MKIQKIARAAVAVGAGVAMTFGGVGVAGATPQNVLEGHTDVVEVHCDAQGNIELESHIEYAGIGHIDPADIADYPFIYSKATAGTALAENGGTWTASGKEEDEDKIPYVGFKYEADALPGVCPWAFTVDVVPSAGSSNPGEAKFVANIGINGQSSTADATRVVLYHPLSSFKEHVHGEWIFSGAPAGGSYDLDFNVYKNYEQTPVGSVQGARFTVQN